MGVIKETKDKVVSKVVSHVKVKREFQVSTWILYIVGIIGIIGIVYGGVQQARIWRWDKLLKASQLRMAELEVNNRQIELEVTKDVATGRIAVTEKKIKKIKKDLKVIEKKKEKIKNNSERMSPIDLRKAFRGEGFLVNP